MSKLLYLGAGVDIYPCLLLPEVKYFLFIDRGDDRGYFSKNDKERVKYRGLLLNIKELAEKLRKSIHYFYEDAIIIEASSTEGLSNGYLKIKFNGDHILEYYTGINILGNGKMQYLSTGEEFTKDLENKIYNDCDIMYILGYEPPLDVLNIFMKNGNKKIYTQFGDNYDDLKKYKEKNKVFFIDILIALRAKQISSLNELPKLRKMISFRWVNEDGNKGVDSFYQNFMENFNVDNIEELYNAMLEEAPTLAIYYFNIKNGKPEKVKNIDDIFFNIQNSLTVKKLKFNWQNQTSSSLIKHDEFEKYKYIYEFDKKILNSLKRHFGDKTTKGKSRSKNSSSSVSRGRRRKRKVENGSKKTKYALTKRNKASPSKISKTNRSKSQNNSRGTNLNTNRFFTKKTIRKNSKKTEKKARSASINRTKKYTTIKKKANSV